MGAEVSTQCGCRAQAPATGAGAAEDMGERSPTIVVPHQRALPTLLGGSDAAGRLASGGKEKANETVDLTQDPAVDTLAQTAVAEAAAEAEEEPQGRSGSDLEGSLPELGVEEGARVEAEAFAPDAHGSKEECPAPAEAPAEEGRASPTRRVKSSRSSRKNRRRVERTEARAQVKPFLEREGFGGVNSSRNRLWASYPLHLAVRGNDPETVRLLIKAGADPKKADALGRTPHQLAERKDREGSHAEVLAALGTKRHASASSSSSKP
mmetsp:Transcript_109722/g.341977  ORF Transcript_109722/g.341977 Transcript_109722/m.341977 type:complete len:266 (-) Transcript_109722:78-875(-)